MLQTYACARRTYARDELEAVYVHNNFKLIILIYKIKDTNYKQVWYILWKLKEKEKNIFVFAPSGIWTRLFLVEMGALSH